jgi:hypothetical protein
LLLFVSAVRAIGRVVHAQVSRVRVGTVVFGTVVFEIA